MLFDLIMLLKRFLDRDMVTRFTEGYATLLMSESFVSFHRSSRFRVSHFFGSCFFPSYSSFFKTSCRHLTKRVKNTKYNFKSRIFPITSWSSTKKLKIFMPSTTSTLKTNIKHYKYSIQYLRLKQSYQKDKPTLQL
jgi:hypothetical protein